MVHGQLDEGREVRWLLVICCTLVRFFFIFDPVSMYVGFSVVTTTINVIVGGWAEG